MLDPVNEYDVHTGARLLDFLDSRSPWNCRLWNVGLSLMLREVLEAAEAVSSGILSKPSLSFLANVAQKTVGIDPGAGSEEEKKVLQRALKPEVRLDSLKYHIIRQQESKLRTEYLARWAEALRCRRPPDVEQTARAVASHLLDVGYSSDFLHRWWKYRLKHEPGTRSLADIVDDAQQLGLRPERSFDVMVPVSRGIRLTGPAKAPSEWRSSVEVAAWFSTEKSEVTEIRHNGGFLFRVPALDPAAAVARVAELLDQLGARVAIGTRRDLSLLGRAWIKGVATPYRLDRTKRGVWVEALEREDQLYDAYSSGGIHAAIELLSHLQSARALKMLREPRRTLMRVQEHAGSAFRRLYRQRNMVLHGARMDAVALRASLRTAAPLVGAGIDRIIHAHYVGKVAPLPLTAQAQVALATIGTEGGPGITTLLD